MSAMAGPRSDDEFRKLLDRWSRPSGYSDPRRHHFVPKFYLRRFANNDDQLLVTEAHHGGRQWTSAVSDVAVVGDFYTILLDDGSPSYLIEHILGAAEGEAQGAIARASFGVLFPPSPMDRVNLSMFLALQAVRGPGPRRNAEALGDLVTKMQLSLIHDDDTARSYLREALDEEPDDDTVSSFMADLADPDFEVIPHQNQAISLMLDSALEVASALLARRWMIGRFAKPCLITSDHPVTLYQHPMKRIPGVGVGLANADEVWFPLDRKHVLVLSNDQDAKEEVVDLPLAGC